MVEIMVNIITSFFSWVTAILVTFLNIELIDGFKFIHIVLFLGITGTLIRFINSRRKRKGDASE